MFEQTTFIHLEVTKSTKQIATKRKRKKSAFENLPGELHNTMYEYVLVLENGFVISHDADWHSKSRLTALEYCPRYRQTRIVILKARLREVIQILTHEPAK